MFRSFPAIQWDYTSYTFWTRYMTPVLPIAMLNACSSIKWSVWSMFTKAQNHLIRTICYMILTSHHSGLLLVTLAFVMTPRVFLLLPSTAKKRAGKLFLAQAVAGLVLKSARRLAKVSGRERERADWVLIPITSASWFTSKSQPFLHIASTSVCAWGSWSSIISFSPAPPLLTIIWQR